MTDGASLEILGGDAFEVPPGHDAWSSATSRPSRSTGLAVGSSRSRRRRSPIASSRPQSLPTCVAQPRCCISSATPGGACCSLNTTRLCAARSSASAAARRRPGDGFFVLFPSPARAAGCAAAMIDAATAHGLTAPRSTRVRSSFRVTSVRGIAVHAAARILGGAAGRSPRLDHRPRPAHRLRPGICRPREVRAPRPQRGAKLVALVR